MWNNKRVKLSLSGYRDIGLRGVIVALVALTAPLACATGQLGQHEEASRAWGTDTARQSPSGSHGARAALVSNNRTARTPTPLELLDLGDRERAEGAYDRAHLAYVRAHFSDRAEIAPLERIAYLSLRSNSIKAETLFRELLEEAPDDPSLLVGLAYAELAQGDSREARAILERAVSIDPNSSAANAALAVTHDTLRDFDRASVSNSRAMAVSGDSVQVLNNQGVSSLLAGKLGDAIRLLRRATSIDPDSRLAANNLGLALGLSGHDQEAYDAFRLHGSRGDALNNLGFVCYLRGDSHEARSHFEAALLSSETNELRVLRNLERLDAALASQ